VIARIGHLHFGAYDPAWLGIEQLPQLNDEVRNRWPSVEGPLPGPVGEWLAVLPALNSPSVEHYGEQALRTLHDRLALTTGRPSPPRSAASSRRWFGDDVGLNSSVTVRNMRFPVRVRPGRWSGAPARSALSCAGTRRRIRWRQSCGQ
jgi:hypothetical protein